MQRRPLIKLVGSIVGGSLLSACVIQKQRNSMYGLIGKIITTDGNRGAFIEILRQGTTNIPGCISYIIAEDQNDANAIWITEVWESKEMHQASLSLPSVQAAIQQGRAMIASFEERIETNPVAGI